MADSNDLLFVIRMQDEASAALKSFANNAGAAGKSVKETEVSFAELIEGAKHTVEVFGSLWAGAAISHEVLESFSQLEQGLFKIRQDAGLTSNELKEFSEQFEALSRNQGHAGESQLLAIADAATQVNVAKEQLVPFTKAINDLGLAADGAGPRYAQMLGQVLNITDGNTEAAVRFADQIAALSKESGQSTATLVTYAKAVAGVTGGYEISKEEVVSLAELLRLVPGRIGPVAGSLAITFAAINRDTQQTRDGFFELSESTGKTVEELQKLAKSDPTAVFIEILKHVDELNKKGIDPKNFLAEFGIEAGEANKVLGILSSRVSEFNKNTLTVKNAKEGTADALGKEYEGTFRAAEQRLENAFDPFKTAIGKALAPGVVAVFDNLASALHNITDAISLVPAGISQTVVQGTVLIAVLASMRAGFGLVKAVSGDTLEYLGLKSKEAAEETGELATSEKVAAITAKDASLTADLAAKSYLSLAESARVAAEALRTVSQASLVSGVGANVARGGASSEAAVASAVGLEATESRVASKIEAGNAALIAAETLGAAGVAGAASASTARATSAPSERLFPSFGRGGEANAAGTAAVSRILGLEAAVAAEAAVASRADASRLFPSFSPQGERAREGASRQFAPASNSRLPPDANANNLEGANSLVQRGLNQGLIAALFTSLSAPDIATDEGAKQAEANRKALEGLATGTLDALPKAVSNFLKGIQDQADRLHAAIVPTSVDRFFHEPTFGAGPVRTVTEVKHQETFGGLESVASGLEKAREGGEGSDALAEKGINRVGGLTPAQQSEENQLAPLFNLDRQVDHLRETLKVIEGLTSGPHVLDSAQLAQARENITLQERKLDPIKEQVRQEALQLDLASQTNARDREAVEIRQALNSAQEKDGNFVNRPDQQQAVAGQVQEKNFIATQTALEDLNRSLDLQLTKLAAANSYDAARLEIAQKLAEFAREHNVAPGAPEFKGYAARLQTERDVNDTKDVTAKFAPQQAATLEYIAALQRVDELNRAGLVTDSQRAALIERITVETEKARSPLEAISTDYQEQLRALQVTGEYHDADVKTLQQLVDLEKQGVVNAQNKADVTQTLTKLNRDLADLQKQQTQGFNGFVSNVGSLQDNVLKAEGTIASGLSSSIADAITGGGLQGIQSLGKALVAQGVNYILADVFKATGLAGRDKEGEAKVQGDVDKLRSLGVAQAQMTIASATITIANLQNAVAGLPQNINPANNRVLSPAIGETPDTGSNSVTVSPETTAPLKIGMTGREAFGPPIEGAETKLAPLLLTPPAPVVAGETPRPTSIAHEDHAEAVSSPLAPAHVRTSEINVPLRPESTLLAAEGAQRTVTGGIGAAAGFGNLPFRSIGGDTGQEIRVPSTAPQGPLGAIPAGGPVLPAGDLTNVDLTKIVPNTIEGREAFDRAYAARVGVNPNLAVAIGHNEGNNPYAQGSNQASVTDVDASGKPFSFGDFQLNYRSGLGNLAAKAGITPDKPDFYVQSDKFAIDYIAAHGTSPFKGDRGLVGFAQSGQSARVPAQQGEIPLNIRQPYTPAEFSRTIHDDQHGVYTNQNALPYRPAAQTPADTAALIKSRQDEYARATGATSEESDDYAEPHTAEARVPFLDPTFKDRIQDLQQDAGDEGIRTQLISGYRSNELQAELYDKYLSGRGNIAAPPGDSLHNLGRAGDINADTPEGQARLNELAAEPFRKITPGSTFGDPNHYQSAEPIGTPISSAFSIGSDNDRLARLSAFTAQTPASGIATQAQGLVGGIFSGGGGGGGLSAVTSAASAAGFPLAGQATGLLSSVKELVAPSSKTPATPAPFAGPYHPDLSAPVGYELRRAPNDVRGNQPLQLVRSEGAPNAAADQSIDGGGRVPPAPTTNETTGYAPTPLERGASPEFAPTAPIDATPLAATPREPVGPGEAPAVAPDVGRPIVYGETPSSVRSGPAPLAPTDTAARNGLVLPPGLASDRGDIPPLLDTSPNFDSARYLQDAQRLHANAPEFIDHGVLTPADRARLLGDQAGDQGPLGAVGPLGAQGGGANPIGLLSEDITKQAPLLTGAFEKVTGSLTSGAGGIQNSISSLVSAFSGQGGSNGGGSGGLGGAGGLLSGLFGGGGGGGVGGFSGGDFSDGGDFADAGLFHTGGEVGFGTARMSRNVDMRVFVNAPRLHTGGAIGPTLGPKEFPAILEQGERVLTANETSRSSEVMRGLIDTGAGRKGHTITNNTYISTPNPSAYRASVGQINAKQALQMRRAIDRNT